MSARVVLGESVVVMEELPYASEGPTLEEVLEYAEWLGLDPEDEGAQGLARRALMEPLPPQWTPFCLPGDENISYYNTETKVVLKEHPVDTVRWLAGECRGFCRIRADISLTPPSLFCRLCVTEVQTSGEAICKCG
jgi:hypothetical protein